MRVRVNGEERVLAPGTTVVEVLERYAPVPPAPGWRGMAVAVDGDVLPRSAWPTHRLADGAVVEVLTAVPGG